MGDTALMNKNLTTPDAISNSWVERAPTGLQPYLRLMRADRPIGTWLLLWPCWWSIALATGEGAYPSLLMLGLFALGAFLMRGAGCVANDMIDHKFDARVERTKNRPIPSGQVSLKMAFIFMALLSLIGLLILVQFNTFAIILGASSLLLVAVYPLMKRITYWPQFVLGLTFNWGALLGWAAVMGEISAAPLYLYAGGLFWTLGYDTIYAHQDKDDDIMIGVKSTALKLGSKTKGWLVVFYGATIALFGLAGWASNMGTIFTAGLLAMAYHFIWQIRTVDIDDGDNCLMIFKSNTQAGWLLFLGAVLDRVL